jgi:hypothetical protein
MHMKKNIHSTFALCVVALSISLGTTACAGTSGGSGSRAVLYDSLESLQKDSEAAVLVTVTGQKEFAKTDSASAYVASTATVEDPFSPASLGEKQGTTALAAGATIRIRQLGALNDSEGAPMLQPGGQYVLFIVPTEAPGAMSDEFYITGGTAGMYRLDEGARAESGAFEKIGNEGDTLPATITLKDLQN